MKGFATWRSGLLCLILSSCLIAALGAQPVEGQSGGFSGSSSGAGDSGAASNLPPEVLPPPKGDAPVDWPPPPPPPSPEEREALAKRLFQLEDARLRLQERIIALQGQSLKALGESDVDKSQVAPDIGRILSMSRQLLILSDQAFAVARRLGAPTLWPEGMRDKLHDMQIRFKKGMIEARKGRQELAKAWKNVAEEGDPVLDEDFESGGGSDEGDLEGGIPATEDQAGQVIQKGGVQEARNLIEVFMGVPESTTPKARLDYYRKLRKSSSR